MHLSPLYAWDELRVYGIDPIFALIMLGHSMGLLRVHLALHVFIRQYLECEGIDVIKNRRVAQNLLVSICIIEKNTK